MDYTRCIVETPNVDDSLCPVTAVVLAIGRCLILTFKWQLGFSVTNGNFALVCGNYYFHSVLTGISVCNRYYKLKQGRG